MTDDNFQDLQKFGKILEEKSNKKNKKTIHNSVKNVAKIKLFVKKISIKLIFTKIRICKYSNFLFFKIQRIKNIKLRKPKNVLRCYRLVEKTKKRRNKIIIVRKRVPFKINPNEITFVRNDLADLVHFTFESGVYFHHKKPSTDDYKLKKSIWDFKIK